MKKSLSLALIWCILFSACALLYVPSSAAGTLEIDTYADGMENWKGSPNKGDESAVTQILFCPTYNGVWSTSLFYPGMPVSVRMKAPDNTVYAFDAYVATIYNGGSWGICRVEPCLLDAANRFIPQKDVVYTATFTLSVNGEQYSVTPDADYVLHEEPIVPGRPTVVHVDAIYDEIENYNGKTCMILGYFDSGVLTDLKNGSTHMKIVITDETDNLVYTITEYSFDTPIVEVYVSGSYSFLRIAVCEYGVIPVCGHSYSLSFEITNDSGVLKFCGVTPTGAFDSFNEAFLDNGAIVPAVIPHTYEESATRRLFSRFDLDGSDDVSVRDVTALLNVVAGHGALAHGQKSDLNGDASTDVTDVTTILNLLATDFLFVRNEADSGWIIAGSALVSGSVSLPDSYRGEPVTQIGADAFCYCRTLESLTIPASVTWIPEGAFSGCAQLQQVTYEGKKSIFKAGGVRVPVGCALNCLIEEDLLDTLDYTGAVQISDLGGYDGILRVKTTGELLFSPNFNELRTLVSNGASYDSYTAYLRFSDENYAYPTVTVDPKKSKGSWVDFFLQGDNIDCGFCPTAGVSYDIELVLVARTAPETPLYIGTYSATASEAFADSPYYAPTPSGQGGEERTYLLRYIAGAGGRVTGETVQYLTGEDVSSAVIAVPDEGYEFTVWSDGVTTAERSGDSVRKNTTLTAYFARHYASNLASVYVYTASGKPILSKEYENATLVIRGAEEEKYNVTLPMTIKGRGNSSWNASASQSAYDSKNSYSIKLEEKAQLLGVGDSKNKKWVLNANKFDLSGLRNYLVWDLARRMGTINYVTECTWVQLYVNDEYRGMYMLTEKIDTGKDRVNVNDDPTGNPDKGYLMELDFRGQNEEDPWFDINGYGPSPSRSRYDAVEFVIKSDIEGQQDIDFIQNYVQSCHNAIMSGSRQAIEELVDLPSLIDMYILEELSKDCDAGRASFYICKDAGGKLFFTAPWDFDFGFGTYGPAQYTTGLVSQGSNCCTWFASLIERSWFREEVLSRMAELTGALNETLDEIEEKGAFLKDDADRNAEFWNLYGNNFHNYVSGQVSGALNSYEEHIEFIIDWTIERWDDLKTAIENK